MSKRLLNMNNFNILAICKFYSRIVLNKLCSETKTCFRASENILTKCIIFIILMTSLIHMIRSFRVIEDNKRIVFIHFTKS